MTVKPVDLFTMSRDTDDFCLKLAALGGDFSFDPGDMIELGKAYFLKYPDSFSDRNMENVHAGYRITRSCIAEKMLEGLEVIHRSSFRLIFDDVSRINGNLARMCADIGFSQIETYCRIISDNLEDVKKKIDELPRGMIKERFIGGITKFYNIMYLLKIGINKIKSEHP